MDTNQEAALKIEEEYEAFKKKKVAIEKLN